ncbi:diguanylate cyclase [Aeromonas lusitana]|uniref:diguanylate cyclase n=1 Tax=Aeromonas lusitana TaxID=931529 RepID=A0A2M8H5H9_9GAMM|nr:GGDEF domain-containing protein [Aeromonas lusitana]PJC91817.1 sensor domain-containing diguanylate cyclase [Aeromonas lusitana]
MEETSRPRISSTLYPLFALLCVTTLVLLFSLIGIFTRPPNLLAAFWPANAVLLGVMLRYPRLSSPSGWLGGVIGYLLASLFTQDEAFKTALLTLGNLAGVSVGYLLFRRLDLEDRRLRRPMSIVFLLLIAMAASLAAGLVGALINPLLFQGSILYGLGFWFASELVNYMAILPVILTLPSPGSLSQWRTLLFQTPVSWASLLPLLSFLFSLLLSLLIAGPGSIAFPVPALLWCAVSYSVFATSLLSLCFSTLTLLALSNGFLVISHDAQTQYWMFSVRIGVMLIALTPLTAASIMAARNSLLRRMEHLAHHDHLTGALNRAGFWPAAQLMLDRLEQHKLPVAVCMLDLDNFKRINDNHGHEAGDSMLRAFTAAVRQHLRQGDLFGRMGGEEFAVLLPNTARQQALEIVERLREAVARLGVQDGVGNPVRVTVSIGIACQRQGHVNLDRLLSQADKALYRAKHNGRNRVEQHQEGEPDNANPPHPYEH